MLTDKIVTVVSEGNLVLGVFLDFSKAIYSVNNSISFNKFYNYGIRGIANNWLQSYILYFLFDFRSIKHSPTEIIIIGINNQTLNKVRYIRNLCGAFLTNT